MAAPPSGPLRRLGRGGGTGAGTPGQGPPGQGPPPGTVPPRGRRQRRVPGAAGGSGGTGGSERGPGAPPAARGGMRPSVVGPARAARCAPRSGPSVPPLPGTAAAAAETPFFFGNKVCCRGLVLLIKNTFNCGCAVPSLEGSENVFCSPRLVLGSCSSSRSCADGNPSATEGLQAAWCRGCPRFGTSDQRQLKREEN